MSDKIQIELKRNEVLELAKLLHHFKADEPHKSRLNRIGQSLTEQFCDQSSLDEINETIAEVNSFFDATYFPELIGE